MGWDSDRVQRGVIITGSFWTSARIISNDRLPLPITMEARPTIATIAVGPDGTVWIAGNDARPDSPSPQTLTVAWSSNAQDPWATPAFSWTRFDGGGEFVVGDQTTWMPNPGGYHGQIWIDLDRSSGPDAGNVYVLASLNPPGSDPMDVFFMRSTDGGTSWSAPLRVNDDPAGTNAWQWFGTMSVAPNGRIDVVWNDTRDAGQTNISQLYYSYSYDAGDTWQVVLSNPTYLGTPPTTNGCLVGCTDIAIRASDTGVRNADDATSAPIDTQPAKAQRPPATEYTESKTRLVLMPESAAASRSSPMA